MDGLLQIGIDVCHNENQLYLTDSEGLARNFVDNTLKFHILVEIHQVLYLY
jgi:hypothetical protein